MKEGIFKKKKKKPHEKYLKFVFTIVIWKSEELGLVKEGNFFTFNMSAQAILHIIFFQRVIVV
jgi:hypothetical protein